MGNISYFNNKKVTIWFQIFGQFNNRECPQAKENQSDKLAGLYLETELTNATMILSEWISYAVITISEYVLLSNS